MVTRQGHAYNLVTGREIGKCNGTNTYRKLSWLNSKTRKIVQVQLHRLIWAYFNGIPDKKLVINHKDGNKQNCNLNNLELTTILDNVHHAYANNLTYISVGCEHHNAVFDDDDVCFYVNIM